MSPIHKISRRQLLMIGVPALAAGTAGLVLGLYTGKRLERRKVPALRPTGAFAPNVFVALDENAAVTVWLTRTEMGQGVATTLPMLVAEELDCDWALVSVRLANANPAYGDQQTTSSASVRTLWEPLRRAGATARVMLVRAAAQRWKCDASVCLTRQSTVIHGPSGRVLRYAELVEAAARLSVPSEVKLKSPAELRLLGTSPPGLDTVAKVEGRARFGLDVRVPGMRFAAIARAPVFGAQLRSVDDSETRKIAGVLAVRRVAAGVGVVAENTWAALRGRDALKLEWDEGPHAQLSSEDIASALTAALDADADVAVAEQRGEAEAILRASKKVIETVYDLPYLAHATMEPINCTARVDAERCEVWLSTQDPAGAQQSAARTSGHHAADTVVQPTFAGGGFGRRVWNDEVVEAVELAAQQHEPVQVVWSREDDIRHDHYRPISRHRLRAILDVDGGIQAWHHRIACPALNGSHSRDGLALSAVFGAVDLQYAAKHRRVDWSSISPAIPVGIWRSVASSYTTFAVECFIDELAAAAKLDPIEFRLRSLPQESKSAQLLKLAAERAGWGQVRRDGRYQGVAISGGVAQIAEISLGASGRPRVQRVVCAVDCGFAVNPAGVRAQIVGGVVFGLSAALYGRISVERGRVQQSNFHDYGLLRIGEMPEVEVYILPSQTAPIGVGELSTPSTAPALVNALAAATGKRVRALPLLEPS